MDTIALLSPVALSASEVWLQGINFLTVGFLSDIGYTEMALLGVIALMLFGSRLPEVARNVGATYRQIRGKVDEFQREFRDWDKDIKTPTRSYLEARDSSSDEDQVKPAAPKFTPPPADDDD